VHAIECKWSEEKFDPKHMLRFREDYPGGKNFVVCGNLSQIKTKRTGRLEVTFLPISLVVSEFQKEFS
jgi:hypothetical protein